jgi:hypothetical protein
MTTALTIVALTFARCGTPFSVQAIYYEKAAQLEFGLPRYMVPAVWYFVASGHTVSQDLPGMARHVYPGLLSELSFID